MEEQQQSAELLYSPVTEGTQTHLHKSDLVWNTVTTSELKPYGTQGQLQESTDHPQMETGSIYTTLKQCVK
jgi:hypothetical protein